jgi:transposase
VSQRVRRMARNQDFSPFLAWVAEQQADARRRQSECGKRALRWALYAIASGIIAFKGHGSWSVAFWGATMAWGLGFLLQLEAANCARIESTMSPFD